MAAWPATGEDSRRLEQATKGDTRVPQSSDQALKLPGGGATRAPVAPGAYAVVTADFVLFEEGRPLSRRELETLGEDGNPEPLIDTLASQEGVREAGLFIPGQPFAVVAAPGERLVLAEMFVESNDLFYSTGPSGLAPFDGVGTPVAGDLTAAVQLWDAGTEVNEAPGAGPNQAPRQKAPNTGPEENGNVRKVSDGYTYPAVTEVLRIAVGGD